MFRTFQNHNLGLFSFYTFQTNDLYWQYTKIASEVRAKTIYEINMRQKDMCQYKKISKTSRVNGRLFEVLYGRVNEAPVNNDSTIFIITVRLLVVLILFIPFYLFLCICSFCFICVFILLSTLRTCRFELNFCLCTRSFISPLVIGEFDFVPSGPRMTFLVQTISLFHLA